MNNTETTCDTTAQPAIVEDDNDNTTNNDNDDNNNVINTVTIDTTTDTTDIDIDIDIDIDTTTINITNILQEFVTINLSYNNPFFCNTNNTFNLHDAMAATQLTDRKMDCCIIPIEAYMLQNDRQNDQEEEDYNQQSSNTNSTNEQQETIPIPIPTGCNDTANTTPIATTTTTTSTLIPSSDDDDDDDDDGKDISQDDTTKMSSSSLGINNELTNDKTTTIQSQSQNKTVFPKPIPDGLYDPMSLLVWDTITLQDTVAIVLQILIRLQSLLVGSSIGESTYTCLYAHNSVLCDMKISLSSILSYMDEKYNNNNVSETTTSTNSITVSASIDDTTTTTTTTTTNVTNGNSHIVVEVEDDTDTHQEIKEEETIPPTTSTVDLTTLSETAIGQLIIYASTVALVDTTEVVRGIIMNADIYEEEDFTSTTNQTRVYTDQNDINTTSIVQSTIKVLSDYQNRRRQQQQQQQQQQQDNDDTTTTNYNDDNDNINAEDLIAIQIIQYILQYQLDFLVSITILARLAQLDLRTNVINVQCTIQNAIGTLQKIYTLLVTYTTDQSQQPVEQSQQISTSSSSVISSTTTKSNNNNNKSKLYFQWMNNNATSTMLVLRKGFDSYSHRPFVGNLPVRKVSFSTPIVAVQLLFNITYELDTILCTILLNGTSIRRIHRILDQYNRNGCCNKCITQSTTNSKIKSTPASSSSVLTSAPSSITINILTRSLLVLNLYFDDKLLGQYPLQDLIVDDIIRSKRPKHLDQPTQRQQQATSYYSTLESVYTSTEHSLSFLQRLAKPTYDILKLRLLNRNRHRAYIEAICLPDWLMLQSEAQVVDRQIRRYYDEQQISPIPNYYRYTQYTLAITIQLMDRYVESGIEVGLFSNTNNQHSFDLSFAYWYRSFLLSALSHNVTRSSHLHEAAVAATTTTATIDTTSNNTTLISTSTGTTTTAATTKMNQKGSKKKGGNKNSTNKVPVQSSIATAAALAPNVPNDPIVESDPEAEDMLDFKFIIIKRTLCRKIVEFIAALQQANILIKNDKDYNNDSNNNNTKRNNYHHNVFQFTSSRKIFDKRFEIFQCIRQPPPLTYDNYLEGVDFSNVTSDELLESASRGFQTARTDLDQLLTEIVSTTSNYSNAEKLSSSNGTNVNNGATTTTTMINPLYVTATIEEIKSLMKICIGNSAYVQKLRQILDARRQKLENGTGTGTGTITSDTKKDDTVKVTFDFDSHVQFCIIKLTTT